MFMFEDEEDAHVNTSSEMPAVEFFFSSFLAPQ